MSAFTKEYWDLNYSEPKTMDGIGNAKDHVRYLKSYFEIEQVDISSIIDFGFGYGYLFKAMLKEFLPYRATGIEPSKYAFKKVNPNKLKPVESTNLKLYNTDIKSWLKKNSKGPAFDLGICTSVFQYISDDDLIIILKLMSKKVKYLYLTVPTNIELSRQIEELDFTDRYAIKRSRKQYQKLIAPHFTIISSRVLESKHFFKEETSPFTDLLYRF